MLSNTIIDAATKFQKSIPGLDENVTDYAIVHDALHYFLGLGVSDTDEQVVLMVERVITGDSIPDAFLSTLDEMVAKLPIEVLIELNVFFAIH